MYSSRSASADQFAFNFPEMLLVFAAGNTGAESGVGSIFNPCLSKNVLCVGATNLRDDLDDQNLQELEVSYFSSLGPTFDGRIKPDVVGPGFKIMSALSGEKSATEESCGITEIQGTSMAAPLVAGSAVIVRQYFMSLWQVVCRPSYKYCRALYPTGYLLKALLIHSGRRVGRYSSTEFDFMTDVKSQDLGSPPDNFQGYGQVTLIDVLPLSRKSKFDLFIYDKLMIKSFETYRFTVTVTQPGFLKATMVWYDPPGSLGYSSNLLLHNLDMTVTTENGTKWYGNNVNEDGFGDTSNPQEQIHIPNAVPGLYFVDISTQALAVFGIQAVGTVITSTGFVSDGPSLLRETEASVNSTFGDPADIVPPLIPNGRIDYPNATSHSVAITLGHTLSANTLYCLAPFTLYEKLLLSSISIDLDTADTGETLSEERLYCMGYPTTSGGSSAFLLAVAIRAPDGKAIQVGGYQHWVTSDDTYVRTWPVQWAGTLPGSRARWKATRNLKAFQVAQSGNWKVCLVLLYEDWPESNYVGTIQIDFSPSPSDVEYKRMIRSRKLIQIPAIFAIQFKNATKFV